jgi:hypothetical protein
LLLFSPPLQEDFAGDPDGSFAGLGPSPVAANSLTFHIPSAGQGSYFVVFFRNSTEPVSVGLVPPGGAILARSAFTILSSDQGIATFTLTGRIPPDTGEFIVGNQGLVCPAGFSGLSDPNEVKGGWPPCTPCPIGSFAATYGATACTICPQGQVAVDTGAVGCILCPATLVAGSPLLLPENAAACTTCGFCCTNACRAAASAIASATTSSLMPWRLGTTPMARVNKTSTTSQQTGTSRPQVTLQSITATASRQNESQVTNARMLLGVCGNRVRELYYTDCWYACLLSRTRQTSTFSTPST